MSMEDVVSIFIAQTLLWDGAQNNRVIWLTE